MAKLNSDNDHQNLRRRSVIFGRDTLYSERKSLRAIAGLSLLISVLTLGFPFTVQALVNNLAFTGLVQPLVIISLILFLVLAWSASSQLAQSWLMERFLQRLFVRATEGAKTHLREHQQSEEESRKFAEISGVQKGFAVLWIDGIALTLRLVTSLLVLMLYHPALGGVSLVLLCAVTLVILYGRREARDLSIEESYAKYSWIGAFSQAKDKPASGSKDIEARDKYLEARNGHFRVFMQQTLLIYAIAVLGGPGIVAIGGYLLLKGQLTIGELVASEMIVGAIIFSLFKIPKILEQYYDYEASLDKVSSIYESHPLLERQSRRVFRRFGMGGTGLTRRVSFVFLSAAVSSPLALILPWVQTSGGYGRVYGYSPEERPQTISATISGRVREWYVNEGQQVEKGQVLARLEDLDPQAIDRLEEQRSAIEAQLKAVAVQRRVAINQFKRQTELARDGIVSTRALEVSETELAKVTQDEAQFLSKLSEMDLKISRQRAQTIVSPVTGFVSRVFRGRGGEILKQGEQLLLIVPRTSTKTAELWIDGRDAPLITIGQSARVQFEGWPAFQFSGWPELGIGTFAARVMMVDQSDENGKFRVILEDSQGTWPNSDVLRQGTRAYGMILLGQVTAGYELWRRMNGFPMLPPEDSLKNVINSRSIGSIASESEAPEGKNGKSGQQK